MVIRLIIFLAIAFFSYLIYLALKEKDFMQASFYVLMLILMKLGEKKNAE